MLIKRPVVVIFPVVFFSILLIAVCLYRRYLSPYLKSIFTQENGMWDPTSRQDIVPHCQVCYGHHQHDQGNSLVSVENESSSLNNTDVQLAIADGRGEIFQPHFVDINISVKKLSLDPHLSDVTTRVDCRIYIVDPFTGTSKVLSGNFALWRWTSRACFYSQSQFARVPSDRSQFNR